MKKIKYLILINLICIIIGFNFSYANSIIYKKEDISKISSGTNLHKFELLTEDGWVTAQMLEVDLNDEYTELEVLNAENGNANLSSIKAMTNAKNAIAGINADFFSGRSGKGHSIGLTINKEELLSSAANENKTSDKMASLIMDEKNEVFYEYIKNKITIYSEESDFNIEASDINKYTSYPEVPTIYTRSWGEYSLGVSDNLKATEFVVENNILVEIRDEMEPCLIPENGFIIMANNIAAEQMKENFKIGDHIYYKVEYTPNVEKINFAISGGAILIENGQIPEQFSHNIMGRNPRTIIGTDKSGKIFYLITIDGRISKSIGMTQQESAEFLKLIGVYNAINLDGGGSTTMVAKEQGNINLTEINTPSGGTERLVANGVGVISNAPKTEKVSALKIVMDETNIFRGEKRKISVVGYNDYYNAVPIESGDIIWDYDGVDVEIKDGEITGNTVGMTYVIAKHGNIKTKLEVNILSDVNEIFITPKISAIAPDKEIKYILQAKNKNGYYAGTNDETYIQKIEKYYKDGILQDFIPDDAKLENLTFKATTSGTYIISFSKGNCTSYAKIDVGIQSFVCLDDFEEKSFYFDPYPDEVGGYATLSTDIFHNGKSSAKLEYDFERDVKIRGAYIVFNKPLEVPKDATHLSFWVYNDEPKDEKLKIKIYDKNNSCKLIILQDNIVHEGWQEIKYSLSGLELPITVTDVYVAQDNENIRESGYIYVDDFGYYTSKILSDDKVKLTKDIKLEDENNINIKTSASYNIAFLDDINDNDYMINWLKNKKLMQDINKDINLTVFTSEISKNVEDRFIENKDVTENESGEKIDEAVIIEEELSKKDNLLKYKNEHIILPKIKSDIYENKGYDLFSNDCCTIITIDVSQNSIRKSDGSQFENLTHDILDDETGNVILVLNNSIDNFEDIKERRAFVDTLCDLKRMTKKNIYVVHNGYFNDYSMERGVKFLGINTSINSFEEYANYSYLIISIKDRIMSYEYKNVF